MAYESKTTPTPNKIDNDDVHGEALKRYERAYNHDRHNILAAFDDLDFCIEENQWSAEDRARRVGRPILTVDKTAQFVRQITGDMRQMRPAIKVVPVDDRGNKEVADKILPGMIRYLEQRSDAQAAYFNGADSQVRAGIGHWRILTEYAGTDTFLQEIRISAIDDGVSVLWDPDSTEPTRCDAMWVFVPVDMAPETFKERWPDKSADALEHPTGFFSDWCTPDAVRVAEYWCKVPTKRKLARMTRGGIDDVTDDPEAEAAAIAAGVQVEERDDFKIQCYIISASDILEGPTEHPGRHIPIVPVIGEEIKRGKSVIRRGVIRGLKDVQRLYNFAISQQAEVVALQPKAPYIGTEKNFERFIDEWETANAENRPFIRYVPDQLNGGQQPSRVAPAASSQGIDDLLNRASADYNAVTGIYPAALGAASNETSGRAILARQREGDTGTYLYIDNFSRAIRRTGQILLDLIPHIYDTERTIRIVGEDGKIDLVRINQAALGQDGMTEEILNDVTVGAYDVAIEMGPSYSTKREEARDGMQAFMQAAGPQVAGLYIDLFAQMQDWPLADKIAKRAQTMLPPPIQMMEAQESGDQVPMPTPMPTPPPTPEQQLAAQEAQMKQEAAARQQDIDKLKAEAALVSIQNEVLKSELALAQANLQMRQTEMQAIQTATEQNTEAKTESSSNLVSQDGGVRSHFVMQVDPRVDEITASVDGMRQVVMQALQDIQGLQSVPPPPDHTSALIDAFSKLASRRTPIGIKRTRDGMQVIFDETPANVPQDLNEAIGALANRKTPIGVKRTRDGMQVVFDE